MRKHHPSNERIKRRYFSYLEEAHHMSVSTVDQVAASIAQFEENTAFRDFKLFHIEQAKRFKRHLQQQTNAATGKPLAKSTLRARLMALKAFFRWLAGQPGYRSKISYSDAEYFNLSANDERIARAVSERLAPTSEQIEAALRAMPADTVLERRDRAIFAFTFLSGARDNAVASLKLRHVDLAKRTVYQDARDVRTKARKTIASWFFPVGSRFEEIVGAWIEELREDYHFKDDEPLFPSTEIGLDKDRKFAAIGISHNHWSDAGAIRKIFKVAFSAADLPYFNPHSFRKTLATLGERRCRSPEEFKAWSQSLGHENVLTTFTSYGAVGYIRQGELLKKLASDPIDRAASLTPDARKVLQELLEAN